MQAEIIAIGTELLLGDVVNTNGAVIARELASAGVGVYYQLMVGDNPDRLQVEFSRAWERSDLVITCGGLGPTGDDLSKETIAACLQVPLIADARWVEHLKDRFQKLGREMTANNLKQALYFQGGETLFNPRGTAPGIYFEREGKAVLMLPGPPSEMKPMLLEQGLPRIKALARRRGELRTIKSRELKVIGVGESALEERIADLIAAQTNPTIATLAGTMEARIRLTAAAESEAAALELIRPLEEEICSRLGDHVYGTDKATLEEVVGKLLIRKGLNLAVAESCTGGLLSHKLTNIPGSSQYLVQGIVAYSEAAKVNLLSVSQELLEQEGVVSRATALAMARGAKKAAAADLAVGITGIAGPDGGSEETPVGTVYIAVISHWREYARRFNFWGDRENIKERACVCALDMLRMMILKDTQPGKER